jgi:surface carbohydrate biosynthesis protein
MDSSLGYESLARDCKIVFLPKRNKSMSQIFGWPYKFDSVGNFWLSKFLPNEKEVDKFLQKNYMLDKNSWLKKNMNIKKQLCIYDIDNSKLKKILKI